MHSQNVFRLIQFNKKDAPILWKNVFILIKIRLHTVNLLVIVTRAHLKQNKNNHRILAYYSPPLDIFMNIFKLIKTFFLCYLEKKVKYQRRTTIHYKVCDTEMK